MLYVIYIYSLQIHITYIYSYSDVCSCMYDILYMCYTCYVLCDTVSTCTCATVFRYILPMCICIYSYSDVCSCMYDILVQVTTREVETALVQSDHMLADNHYATTSLRELAWNMRELLEDFTARIEERERTLHEAADFFRAAEKVCTCQTQSHACSMYINMNLLIRLTSTYTHQHHNITLTPLTRVHVYRPSSQGWAFRCPVID